MEEAYQLIKEDLGSKHHRSQSQDSNWTEDSSVTDLEGEDSLKPDELVNCICDFYEENGLMIQVRVMLPIARRNKPAIAGSVFSNHSQEYSLSPSPRFCQFLCNTTSDLLNYLV